MKSVKIETVNGKSVITTTETRRFLFFQLKPRVRQFVANSRIAGRYWNWLELPDKTIVPDRLSFQLDAWLESAEDTTP